MELKLLVLKLFTEVSIIMFCLAVFSILTGVYKNLINILISFELMFLSLSMLFNIFSYYHDDAVGQLIFLIILTVAGAESAIGLALVITHYKISGSINLLDLNKLRG